jgi:hypothetical protein
MLTTLAFKYFSIGIFALMITTLAMRVLYALKQMYLVLLVSIVVAGINIGLFYPLVRIFGHAGIPLAISVGLIIETIVFLFALELITHIKLKEFFVSVIKITIPTVLSVALMYLVYIGAIRLTGSIKTLYMLASFVASGIVFAIFYVMLLKVLKVEELNTLISLFKK